MKTTKIFITGTVQGIFFRRFIKEEAEKLGLKGFVRNLDDGRIEVVAEGKDENINKMIAICKKGSAHSIIKNVQSQEIRNQGFDSFKVLSL